jgi:hypothetical protein
MPSPETIATNFPIQILPLVASGTEQPTYNSILEVRTALNSNATTIPSDTGIHGHLALVLTAPEYLAVAGVAYLPPVHPGPVTHAPLATAAQIIETNRLHKSATNTFQTYHAVDHALRKLLIAATPEVYIRSIKDPLIGFGRVTTLDILTHLRTTYGEISPEDLEENQLRMATDWNPPTPIEELFEQLRAGLAFATEGGDAPSAPRLVRLGYSIIIKTGLFELGCREWRNKPDVDKTFAAFQVHFKRWDRDRLLLLNTRMAGYHGANHVEPPTANLRTEPDEMQFMRDQIATLTAAMAAATYAPPAGIPGTVFTAPTAAATIAATTATARTLSYCWTHGTSNNARHTSATCQHPDENHQSEATMANPMGGSTRVWTEADRRAPR